MRLIVLLFATLFAISFATSGPAFATSKPNRGQCKRLAKQMSVHHVSMDAAISQGNALWARSLDQQIGRMLYRQNRLCPDLAENRRFAAAIRRYNQTKQFLAAAGKAALQYFTFGAY